MTLAVSVLHAIKDDDHEDMGNGGRRRYRGFAKQALVVALMVFSVNVRRLRDYINAYGKTGHDTPTDPGPEGAPQPRMVNADLTTDESPPHRTAA